MNSKEKIAEILVAQHERWFDVKTMAEEASVSESTVRRAYKALHKKQGIEMRELNGRVQFSYFPPVVVEPEKQRRRWFRRNK